MGQTPFLTRLALGRSAFERFVDPESFFSPDQNGTEDAGNLIDSLQQYDESGRPNNSVSKGDKEAQVRAMNEVLEVVGVTERKSEHHDAQVPTFVFTPEIWKATKTAEDDLGENIFLLTETTYSILTWWIDVLRRRIQAGLMDCSTPFAHIVRNEWSSLHHGSWTDVGHFLTAGLEMDILGTSLIDFATELLSLGTAVLRHKVRKAKIPPMQKRLGFRCINTLKSLGRLAIEVLFSPFMITSVLRQFRLIDLSAVPAYKQILPWDFKSLYQLGWPVGASRQTYRERVLNVALSPISLLLAMPVATTLLHDISHAVSHSSSTPAIVAPIKPTIDMAALGHVSPLSIAIARPIITARDFVLRLLGWSYEQYLHDYHHRSQKPPSGEDKILTEDLLVSLGDLLVSLGAEPDELNEAATRLNSIIHEPQNALSGISQDPAAAQAPLTTNSNGQAPRRRKHRRRAPPAFRTTRLSTLPADLLRHHLGHFGRKMALLPLEILLHRSVIVAFSQAQAGTVPSQGVAKQLLADLAGLGSRGWARILAKVGLCLMLEASVGVVLWGGVWAAVDWFGTAVCAWGMT